jgi:hypothetical protein
MQRPHVTDSFEEKYGNNQTSLAGFDMSMELVYSGYQGLEFACYTGRTVLALRAADGAEVRIRDAVMERLANGHMLISFPWSEAIPEKENPTGAGLLGHYVWRERLFSLWLDEKNQRFAFFKGARLLYDFSTSAPRWKVYCYLRGHEPLVRTYEAWRAGWLKLSGIERRRHLGFDISLRYGFSPADCHMQSRSRAGATCRLLKSAGHWSNGATPTLRPAKNQ